MSKDSHFRSLLEDVASGRISPIEAERRLDDNCAQSASNGKTLGTRSRLMHVVVETKGDCVNARVPMPLLKWGLGLASLLPSPLLEVLKSKGLDVDLLGEIGTEDLQKALGELEINYKGSEGTAIRVFTE